MPRPPYRPPCPKERGVTREAGTASLCMFYYSRA